MVLVNMGVAVLILILFRRADFSGLRGLVTDFGVSLVFANAIGGPMAFMMPRISRRFRTAGAVRRWAALLSSMVAIALGGSLVAILLLIGIGYLPASAFSAWFARSARWGVFFALTIGVAVTLYETMRARLAATTLALRTKERDEADARRIAAEARLASLESRVQPHFLFNTLNSIAALIPQDPAGAERMTGQLASLLRTSLDAANAPLVPLTHELHSVHDYLEIERVRFGDRLRFEVNVPEDLRLTRLPRLALQTLVENSVKFAVSPRREGGHIRVSGERAGDLVHLRVEDDGAGFEMTDVPEHHGLALLRDRLRMSFPASGALDVERVPGRTRVTLTVPR